MATFYINGRFYATQEYNYIDEVEADSLEEAVELHRAQCEGLRWPNVDADTCDKPFNIEGRFDVFETEEGREINRRIEFKLASDENLERDQSD